MAIWPRQAECLKFYGRPGTNHMQIELPYPMVLAWDTKTEIHRISINKKCAESALRVLNSALSLYGIEKLKDLGVNRFGGCFNNRPMRGGTNLSMHAFACAIDFDPERNQLKWDRRQARLAQKDADRWWELWEKEGWVSLGRARDFDWMHVQAARL